jgi:hypothetical protein
MVLPRQNLRFTSREGSKTEKRDDPFSATQQKKKTST